MNPFRMLFHRLSSRKGALILGMAVSVLTVGSVLAQVLDWQLNGSDIYYDAGRVVVGGSIPSHPAATVSIQAPAISGFVVEDTTTTTKAYVAAIGNRGLIGTLTNSDLDFKTNGASHLTVSRFGNVGIGTQLPSSKLHVDGDITLSGNLVSDGGMICIGNC